MFHKIFFIAVVGFIILMLSYHEESEKQILRTYYRCKDLETKEYLIPLTSHQYNILKSSYTDFSSMYSCYKKKYTRYHLKLMKVKK